MNPRRPLTDEEKQVLRDRLATARAAKAAKQATSPTVPPVPKKRSPRPNHASSETLLYTPWGPTQWQSLPLDQCLAQLALLRRDFEEGARIVGQRNDINRANQFKCYVCQVAVADSKWSWKQDYLDHSTGTYKSVVVCSQQCFTVLANDTRRKQALKDLIEGKTGSHTTEQQLIEQKQ